MPLFTYSAFAVFGLTILTFVLPLKLKTRAQALWTALLLFCFSKFYCFDALGGHAFNPDLPAAVIWAWDWLYTGAMILSALALLTVLFRFRAKVWLLPLLAWGMAAWGLYEGVRTPSVREVELSFADLPPALDGYRVVQLSDLHCSSSARRWRTSAIVERVNALRPDLICLTGDLADGQAARIAPYLEPIRALQAKDGVFACMGNHEYYYDMQNWRAWLDSSLENVRFLLNDCVLPRPGLAVGGVTDKTGWLRHKDIEPDARGAFAAATNGEFRILLQHRPDGAIENCREAGVNLQLSGHTHGGIAPIIRTIVCRVNGGFALGVYRFGPSSVLYVCPGCGQWAGFPTRFFNDSEIALLTLRRSGPETGKKENRP